MGNKNFFSGKKVFLTGHTGFKGSWLSRILILSGAEVTGYSQEPPTEPNLFSILGLEKEKKNSGNNDGDDEPKHPLGLNDTVPVLTVTPTHDSLCSISGGFDFMVEYDYRGDKPFYVALALHDLRRGGIPFGDSFDLTESGHHTVHFHLPMTLFNNGEFRITASMHTWDGSHASTAEMIAFTNENN